MSQTGTSLILAFHCIFTAYGFWLPNEPRGSWSTFVASWELLQFGPATKITTRRSIANRPYDRNTKSQMQSVLAHPPVHFDEPQIEVIGNVIAELPYNFHALAVMPDHVHVVIGRTNRDIRRVVGHTKSAMTRALREQNQFIGRSPWADHGWNVYLDSPVDVSRAIAYVEHNPTRAGLPKQQWTHLRPI